MRGFPVGADADVKIDTELTGRRPAVDGGEELAAESRRHPKDAGVLVAEPGDLLRGHRESVLARGRPTLLGKHVEDIELLLRGPLRLPFAHELERLEASDELSLLAVDDAEPWHRRERVIWDDGCASESVHESHVRTSPVLDGG